MAATDMLDAVLFGWPVGRSRCRQWAGFPCSPAAAGHGTVRLLHSAVRAAVPLPNQPRREGE